MAVCETRKEDRVNSQQRRKAKRQGRAWVAYFEEYPEEGSLTFYGGRCLTPELVRRARDAFGVEEGEETSFVIEPFMASQQRAA